MGMLDQIRTVKPTLLPTDYTTLVYGPPGVGKTTFVKQVAEALGRKLLFIAFEDGHKHIECDVFRARTFQEVWALLNELSALADKGECPYDFVCFDTVDGFHSVCRNYVLQGMNIKHETDLDYGKGWSAVKTAWSGAVNKLQQADFPVWMISHSRLVEVETPKAKYNRIVPSLGDKPLGFLSGAIDLIMYVSLENNSKGAEFNDNRVLHTTPNNAYLSKSRLPGNVTIHDIVLEYETGAQLFVDTFKQTLNNRGES